MSDEEQKNGWGWPGLSRKAHYFEQGMSLCRRWMYRGQPENYQGGQTKDDCVACWKVLHKRTADAVAPKEPRNEVSGAMAKGTT